MNEIDCSDRLRDVRSEMEYGESRLRLDAAACSFCARKGDYSQFAGYIVTKHRHVGHPLGQLYTRCPEHQIYYLVSEVFDG